MFSELPKLLGRDFAIGSLLPTVVFLTAVWAITRSAGMGGDILAKMDTASSLGVTAIVLAAWLFAVALSAVNRLLYRLLEGYGALNPLKLLAFIERWRFRSLNSRMAMLKHYVATRRGSADTRARAKQVRLGCRLAQRYPDQENWLLPTSFGNTIRAFEVYPRVVYGLEGIQGWARILPLISKEFLDSINSAKAQADFWVNLLMLTIVGLAYYVAIGTWRVHEWHGWVVAVALLSCFFFYVLARHNVEHWGELVKAAFDVYIVELQKKLGMAAEGAGVASRDAWQRRSQSMIYRRPV